MSSRKSVPADDPFDPERLRLAACPARCEAVRKRSRLPRHRQGEEFLRGPIPLVWLRRAGELRGKALAVAVALWFKAGTAKGNPEVAATAGLLERLGVGRKAGYRGLAALERAGLVSIERRPGRSARVTILPVKKIQNGDS